MRVAPRAGPVARAPHAPPPPPPTGAGASPELGAAFAAGAPASPAAPAAALDGAAARKPTQANISER